MGTVYETAKEALDLYEVITEVLNVFVSTEIGTEVEFDNEVIARYINSFDCALHFFEANTKEGIYEQFTNDILNGYPVWQMLKLPDWTRRMVEKTFATEQAEAWEKAKKRYKCLTCKFYKERRTIAGVLSTCAHERCSVNKAEFRTVRRSKGVLKQLRKSCKLYERSI